MKKSKIILIVYLIALKAIAQSSPGAVSGVKFWIASKQISPQQSLWENKLPEGSKSSFSQRPTSMQRSLNYNCSFNVANNAEPSLLLGKVDLSQLTIFTVYQPENAYLEKSIWYFDIIGDPGLILSTHRLADLESRKYFNYAPQKIDIPRINTFTQYKKNLSDKPRYSSLHFGASPEHEHLPLTNFTGLIPEIIIFDRVLTPIERSKVESYLALKYGLTLFQNGPSLYLNSQKEVIWDGFKNAPAYFNVAGIGRDDASDLFQKQSTSSYDPGLLVIAAKKIAPSNQENLADFPDNNFLIWGDDGANLKLVRDNSGNYATVLRKWTMDGFGEASQKIPTMLAFDFGKVKTSISTTAHYWLIIDRNGNGKFLPANLEFVPASSISGDGRATFSKVLWDEDQSGKDVFTFGISAGPDPANWVFAQDRDSLTSPSVNSFWEKVLLYPNPVGKNNFFNLELGLQKPESATIQIHDAQGKLIQQRLLEGSTYYFYTGQLNVPGLYTVRIKMNEVEKTLPLIVE